MKVKSFIMAIVTALLMAFSLPALSAHVVNGVPGGHMTSGIQKVGAGVVALVFADAIMKSNAQGVLPCHSKPNVVIDKGGYKVTATDCEVNGFK